MIDNTSNKWSNNPELDAQMEQLLGQPQGYFDTVDKLRADNPPVVQKKDISEAVREQIHTWIREDAPITVKMTMSKEQVDKLVARITKVF